MNAKDTVMGREEIQTAIEAVPLPNIFYDKSVNQIQEEYRQGCYRAVAEAQAKITWDIAERAGIEKGIGIGIDRMREVKSVPEY